jgi:hypothetical protein
MLFERISVISKLFYFERSPDERAYTLGVVVADRLIEIVGE